MQPINKDKLLEVVREMIKSEAGDIDTTNQDPEVIIKDYVLPALNRSKDIQADLYADFTYQRSGVVSGFKNFILRKIANITRNVVEKSMLRQQKFNNNIYQLLEYLLEENLRLKNLLEDKTNDKD